MSDISLAYEWFPVHVCAFMLQCDLIFRPFPCWSWRELNLWLADQPGAGLPRPGLWLRWSNIHIPLFMSVQRHLWNNNGAQCNYTLGLIHVWYGVKRHEAPTLCAAFPAHVGPVSVPLRSGNLWVSPLSRGQTSCSPRHKWATGICRGRRRRGRRLVAKCVCIIHVACKLASCRLLRRNRRDFEIHFFFPHSSQGSSQRPVHFISIHLRGYSGPALIPLFSSCVSDWIIQYAASHLFTRVFPLYVSAFFFLFVNL